MFVPKRILKCVSCLQDTDTRTVSRRDTDPLSPEHTMFQSTAPARGRQLQLQHPYTSQSSTVLQPRAAVPDMLPAPGDSIQRPPIPDRTSAVRQ